jgi:hypothetical protein
MGILVENETESTATWELSGAGCGKSKTDPGISMEFFRLRVGFIESFVAAGENVDESRNIPGRSNRCGNQSSQGGFQ